MAHALTIIMEALMCILNLLQSLREWINLDSLTLISAGVSFVTRMKSEKKLLLTLESKGWQLKGSKYYFTRRNVWQYWNMLYLEEKVFQNLTIKLVRNQLVKAWSEALK